MNPLQKVEEVYHRSFGKAYRAAKSICLNKQLAEDAVSEAVVRLMKLAEKGRLRSEAENLFITIAINEAKRILSKRPAEYEYQEYLDARSCCDVEQREQALDLLTKINTLPSTLNMPLKLHYYGGFSYGEISEALKISLDAVKKRVSRGRQKLKEMYRDDEDMDGGFHEV